MSNNLARRSVSSAQWRTFASLFSVSILFIRSIALARLIPIEVFGVYAMAGAIIALTIVFADFGMPGAFLHRSRETEDEGQAAAVLFTLNTLFVLTWGILLIAGALIFAEGQLQTALLVLTITIGGLHVVQTPQLILMRQVRHRRLAVIQLLSAAFSTLIAVGLAWQGATIWALLATDGVALIITFGILYLWRPVWRWRVAWTPDIVRYYLHFGSRTLLADVLLRAQDEIDDLWTGANLGQTALGFYSRAYTFATYPRRILATPINLVAGGTYAELKHDRRTLSKAFFRTNSFLVRIGFPVAGLLALLAPEMIRILLGEKWLPMLEAFRLMLVFTMLDPIRTTVADLFVAVGQPSVIVKTRLVQLIVLIAGLYVLGMSFGISGVALAVNIMLVVGLGIMLRQARSYVDFSLSRLFFVPGLALILGLIITYAALSLMPASLSVWLAIAVKSSVFVVVFGGVLLALERKETISMLRRIISHRR